MNGAAAPEDGPPVRVSAQGGEPASGWLPHPVLSLVIVGMWVLLADSVRPGTWAMGALVGWAIPIFARVFLPVRPDIRSVGALVRFVPRFAWDVVVANFQVAALILTVGRQPRPQWLVIPLELRDPHAVTVLANVISLTPGTVSSELGPDRRTLLVHALDVDDPEEEVARIKTRYEQPLKEIFEC
jgi:multicomponent K+:H+ antiporter subunit E